MKLRKWKIAAFLATSAVLLQVGGCATIIVQILAQQVFTSTLRSVLDLVLGDGNSDTATEATP